jgi:mannose-6-phosphate isomerase-like protein (cupin superfamily)
MKDSSNYIESGMIESYVLGLASPDEIKELEELALSHVEVRKSIDFFSKALEKQAMANAVTPDPIIKPMLMATIDFISRMEKGETPAFPPDLNESSKIADYEQWLNRPEFVVPPHFTDVHARIIAYTPQVTTAIVWIKELAPQEVHHDEYEKFLIVEGSCEILIGETVHQLVPGNFLSIPLHQNHLVKVTSAIPCKAILQRVAA